MKRRVGRMSEEVGAGIRIGYLFNEEEEEEEEEEGGNVDSLTCY
jgi:hypothetical protein